MKLRINIVAICLLTIFLFPACATYYQKQHAFQENFSRGQLEKAQSFLERNKKAAEKKDRLLYFLDRGVVEQMLGNYEESNAYFEQAYIFSQDFRKSFANDLVGMVANPMLKPYQGEDFEIVLLHFYKAINFIQLNQFNEALVEVRRVNIKLNELNDKYEDKKNRYKQDAFAYTLMGIIYEAKNEYNDAFIAYRNAYETYKELYEPEFGVSAPDQLKKDLLRTAAYNGFRNELDYYEKEFKMTYDNTEKEKGSLVFFWLNGLGPVKSEFSLNLSTIQGKGGVLTFANEQEGFSVPYQLSANQSKSDFSDLKFVRLAIPKYNSRHPLVDNARLEVDSSVTQKFQLAEDINDIAISTLQDRLTRELAQSIGRLAIKQASEMALRKENEDLGALIGMVNAATEKADTRNWQTLPHSISYQRVFLDSGNHKVNFISERDKMTDTVRFNFHINQEETVFRTYHTLESTLPVN